METDYEQTHQHPINLVVHIVAVPVFVAGVLLATYSVLTGQALLALLAIMLCPLSLAVQAYGHQLEAIAPAPFAGPVDFVRRISAEQFGRFWVFLFSGRWYRSFRRRTNG